MFSIDPAKGTAVVTIQHTITLEDIKQMYDVLLLEEWYYGVSIPTWDKLSREQQLDVLQEVAKVYIGHGFDSDSNSDRCSAAVDDWIERTFCNGRR